MGIVVHVWEALTGCPAGNTKGVSRGGEHMPEICGAWTSYVRGSGLPRR